MPPSPHPAARLRGLASWLDHWPNRCAVCHADTTGAAARICADCILRFAPAAVRCPRCALRAGSDSLPCGACLLSAPPWSLAVAACDYGYPWDGLLTALKFRAALDLLPALAALLLARIPDQAAAAVDLLLPVPLATARLRERGYNQAGLLAAQLARRLHRARSADLLLRVTDTPHQIALPRERRAANVRGAFAPAPGARALLQGRHIALIDDVMTTGATCAEVTRVLLLAGAASVQVWAVARTPTD